MLTTNVLPWLRNRRVVALIVSIALVVSLAFSVIGNSWTTNAAPEDATDVVAEDDITLAGPSWTFSRGIQPPVDFFGPSWG